MEVAPVNTCSNLVTTLLLYIDFYHYSIILIALKTNVNLSICCHCMAIRPIEIWARTTKLDVDFLLLQGMLILSSQLNQNNHSVVNINILIVPLKRGFKGKTMCWRPSVRSQFEPKQHQKIYNNHYQIRIYTLNNPKERAHKISWEEFLASHNSHMVSAEELAV